LVESIPHAFATPADLEARSTSLNADKQMLPIEWSHEGTTLQSIIAAIAQERFSGHAMARDRCSVAAAMSIA
jgi:hypothetical protein